MKRIIILFLVMGCFTISACTVKTNAPANSSNTTYTLDSVNPR